MASEPSHNRDLIVPMVDAAVVAIALLAVDHFHYVWWAWISFAFLLCLVVLASISVRRRWGAITQRVRGWRERVAGRMVASREIAQQVTIPLAGVPETTKALLVRALADERIRAYTRPARHRTVRDVHFARWLDCRRLFSGEHAFIEDFARAIARCFPNIDGIVTIKKNVNSPQNKIFAGIVAKCYPAIDNIPTHFLCIRGNSVVSSRGDFNPKEGATLLLVDTLLLAGYELDQAIDCLNGEHVNVAGVAVLFDGSGNVSPPTRASPIIVGASLDLGAVAGDACAERHGWAGAKRLTYEQF